MSAWLRGLVLLALVAVIFVVDLLTPVSVAVWVFYLIPGYLLLAWGGKDYLVAGLLLVTLLIVIGLVYSPPNWGFDDSIVDRSLAVVMLWVVGLVAAQRQVILEALRKSEERYATATAAGRAGVWEWRPESDTFFLDPRVLLFLDRRDLPAPTTLANWLEWVELEDRAEVRMALLEHFAGGTPQVEQLCRIRHHTGEIRWFLMRGLADRDAEDRVLRLVGTLIDITERKREEEALWEKEGMLQAINDNLPRTAIFQLGADSPLPRRFYYVSAGIEQLTGLRRERVPHEAAAIVEQILPEDLARLRGALAVALEQGTPVAIDFRRLNDRGEERWCHLRARSRTLPSGKVVWDGLELDITERKRLELAVAHSRVRLHEQQVALIDLLRRPEMQEGNLLPVFQQIVALAARLLDLPRVGIWRLINQGQTLRCEALVEPSTLTMPGQEIHSSAAPAYFRELQRNDALLVEDVSTDPRTRELSEGYSRPLGISALLDLPILRGGHLAGVLCLEQIGPSRGWTGEDRLFGLALANLLALALEQDDRKQAETRAEQANRAKSEFLSRMSHELRTPLNAILGFGQLLHMSDQTEDQRSAVEHILTAGRHLLELIDEVLDLARIEAGKMQLTLRPVEVATLVRQSVDIAHPLATTYGIVLHADPQEAGNAHVLGESRRLRQVILNLLTNAIKYNREKGQVFVRISVQEQGTCRIAVSDTGRGLTRDQLARLFIPFDRLGAEQTEIEGIGLGLAWSKKLTEAMGGTLSVESVVGQGSTFTVELAAATPPTRESALPLTGAKESKRQIKVLYVEDNATNRKLIERALRRRPEVELVCAPTAQEGLDRTRSWRPDIVLLDVHMPDFGGEEFLRRLSQDADLVGIPVLAVSADASPSTMAAIKAAGARHYLTKPLELSVLLRLIEETLRPAT